MEKLIQPRDFESDEIREINQYIIANVPYSVLQTTLPITDNPLQKARVFTIVYRFINGSKNYVSNEKTRVKLIRLLEQNIFLYKEVYEVLSRLDNISTNFGRGRILNKLLDIYQDFDKNIKINNFIDIFLVFAEKQLLINIDEVTGINLETEEGKEAYDKIMEGEKE